MARVLVLFLLAFAFDVFAVQTEPDSVVLPKLRKALKGQSELATRSVKKIGNRTIEFESMLVQEGDIKYAEKILTNYSEYGRWALKNINKRPGGGSYYLQILSLVTDPKDPNVLRSTTLLDLPVFHHEIQREFKMKSESSNGTFTMMGEALPNEKSLIETSSGYMRLYPAEGMPGRVWIYVHGTVTLKNWIVYEAVPDRIMNNEAGERIQIVLDNYLAEEERVRQQAKKQGAGPAPASASSK